ncbi:MAG TPA: hypothetical protein VFU23_07840 [Gemmatimonadales bacterium]|nr:hypothetical protein [Gemmatimonadales bacterium]
MSLIAGLPSWMVLIFGMMIVSSTMRLIFGNTSRPSRFRTPRKWELFGRQEVERLEAAINERDVVIEDLQQRLSELESRLDFTERMIASRSAEPARENAAING